MKQFWKSFTLVMVLFGQCLQFFNFKDCNKSKIYLFWLFHFLYIPKFGPTQLLFFQVILVSPITLIWKENVLKMIFLPNLKGTRQIINLVLTKYLSIKNPTEHKIDQHYLLSHRVQDYHPYHLANSLLCNWILHVIDYV